MNRKLLSLISFSFILSFILLLSRGEVSETNICVKGDNGECPNSDSTEEILDVEHSFNGEDFKYRSSFKIQFADFKVIPLDKEKNGIAPESVDEFRRLLSNNDLYSIRIRSKLGQSLNQSVYIMASIPSCEIAKSGFKEDISIHLDINNKYIVGMSYSSPVLAVPKPCDPASVKNPQQFLSRVKIVDRVEAQVVPLQVSGPRPPQLETVLLGTEDDVKPSDTVKNQSLLMRYWYIWLPLLVFLFTPTDGGAKPEAK